MKTKLHGGETVTKIVDAKLMAGQVASHNAYHGT